MAPTIKSNHEHVWEQDNFMGGFQKKCVDCGLNAQELAHRHIWGTVIQGLQITMECAFCGLRREWNENDDSSRREYLVSPSGW